MKSLEVRLNEALEVIKARDVTIAALKKTLDGVKEAKLKEKKHGSARD
jgi:hypothetical protein